MNKVFCVFEELENYYDDNDKTLFAVVDTEEKAKELVDKYPNYNLCYEIWSVR